MNARDDYPEFLPTRAELYDQWEAMCDEIDRLRDVRKRTEFTTVTYPIHKIMGACRRSEAPAQLFALSDNSLHRWMCETAHYRLLVKAATLGMLPVDDEMLLEIKTSADDFVRDDVTLVATCRCIEVGKFKVPAGEHSVTIPVQL